MTTWTRGDRIAAIGWYAIACRHSEQIFAWVVLGSPASGFDTEEKVLAHAGPFPNDTDAAIWLAENADEADDAIAGLEWTDAYWPEALEMVSFVRQTVEGLLRNHPAIERTPGGSEAVDEIAMMLGRLYQDIGRAEFEETGE